VLTAIIAVAVPFVTTTLGAVGFAQIKHSNGNLYGRRLAAVAVLVFPLQLLGVLVFFGAAFAWSALGFDKPGTAHAPVPEMLAALVVCVIACVVAWRKIGPSGKEGVPSVGAPAAWMIVGAVASLIMVLWLGPETWQNYTKGHFTGAGTAIRFVALAVFAALAATALQGALKMLGKEDYAASRRAAVCSLFSIFGIITLPAGIWALVRLSKPEVKALFPARPSAPRAPSV
jgi:hypothetical protein